MLTTSTVVILNFQLEVVISMQVQALISDRIIILSVNFNDLLLSRSSRDNKHVDLTALWIIFPFYFSNLLIPFHQP